MHFLFRAIALLFLSLNLYAEGLWPVLPDVAPAPVDNPVTPEKVHLGKELFFDKRLSKDGTVSCNSCHAVISSGTDNRPVSVGIGGQKGGRSAPTVWNSAFNTIQFWDGRASSLEEQAKGPLTNPIEMGMPDHASVIARVKEIPGYVEEFKKAFPEENSLTIENLAKAIATYERTLITPNSPYDRFAKGETQAISARAERGMRTAESVGCMQCHSGPAFNGVRFPGQMHLKKFPTFTDNDYVKKYDLLSDGGKGGNHIFKVPTLRNISETAPYFHNGSVKTLSEAVKVMAVTQLGVQLTEEQTEDIVEFLNTLSGEFPEQTMPRLPGTQGKSLVGE